MGMNLKIYCILCSVLLIGLYMTAFTQKPPLFILYLGFASLAFSISTFLLLTQVLLKFLPGGFRKLQEQKITSYRLILFLSALILVFAVRLFNHSIPSDTPYLLRVLAWTGILGFTFFLSWTLLKRNGVKVILSAIAVFALFFFAVVTWASNYQGGRFEINSGGACCPPLPNLGSGGCEEGRSYAVRQTTILCRSESF
jgi:hypothetical protein